MTQTELQADAVAKIALTLPVNPTTRDVLRALAMSFRAGWQGGLSHAQSLAMQTLERHL